MDWDSGEEVLKGQNIGGYNGQPGKQIYTHCENPYSRFSLFFELVDGGGDELT